MAPRVSWGREVPFWEGTDCHIRTTWCLLLVMCAAPEKGQGQEQQRCAVRKPELAHKGFALFVFQPFCPTGKMALTDVKDVSLRNASKMVS